MSLNDRRNGGHENARLTPALLGRALPLVNNPVFVAEEFAMLDVMSNGRLIAGMVVGGFLAARAERLERIIGACLMGAAVLLFLVGTGLLPGALAAAIAALTTAAELSARFINDRARRKRPDFSVIGVSSRNAARPAGPYSSTSRPVSRRCRRRHPDRSPSPCREGGPARERPLPRACR